MFVFIWEEVLKNILSSLGNMVFMILKRIFIVVYGGSKIG